MYNINKYIHLLLCKIGLHNIKNFSSNNNTKLFKCVRCNAIFLATYDLLNGATYFVEVDK